MKKKTRDQARQVILDKIVKDKKTGCWNWTGKRGGTGSPYGYTRGPGALDGGHKQTTAHRVAYNIWTGDIPDGYQVDHLCYNTLCCNPDHLEAVTPAENNRRRRKRV